MMCSTESHKVHNFVNIDDAADEFEDGLRGNVASLADGFVRCQIVKKTLTENRKEFVLEAEKAVREIFDRADHLKKKLNARSILCCLS